MWKQIIDFILVFEGAKLIYSFVHIDYVPIVVSCHKSRGSPIYDIPVELFFNYLNLILLPVKYKRQGGGG